MDSKILGRRQFRHVTILQDYHRFRHLENIVLWDTPELHLNAALEARLYDAISRIAPKNHYWIATHSLEFINSVPLESIFIIRQAGTSATIERATGEERQTRITMYREMGAQVGLQLVSSVVAFVEGKEASADKRMLDRLVAPELPGINFVAGGSCESLLSVETRANRLLAEACTNGDFLAIVDRDYRSDEEVQKIVSGYRGRLFMWQVHEIENLFIDPLIVFETLHFLGYLEAQDSVEMITVALKSAATDLRDWMAADWVAWEFDQTLQLPSRRIAGDTPKTSLQKYAAALQSRIVAATDMGNLESRFQEKCIAIDTLLAGDSWLQRLPGKQLLRKLLAPYPSLSPEQYLRSAAGVVLDRKIQIPELERLKDVLRQVPMSMIK